MKNSIGVLLLALVSVGLCIALIVSHNSSKKRQAEAEARIEALSNSWVRASDDLNEQRQVAAMFEKDLEQQKGLYTDLTNSFSMVSSNLKEVNANLSQTAESLKLSEEEVKKRDARINDLQGQNEQLDKQAVDLTHAITNLNGQIVETERKLSVSEGDRVFLQSELKRLMAEKAALERQFNDLAVLRAQVSKLKEELSVARRIEWIRRGLFANTDQKGAQKLMSGVKPPSASAKPRPNYDLNVEVTSEGSVRVIPVTTNSVTTNAPAK